MKGVRFIGGVEFILAGRVDDAEAAEREAAALRREWDRVKKLKDATGDYRLWVHGRKAVA